MTTIKDLIKENKLLSKDEENIKARLVEIYNRKKALESEIQDRCKHIKSYSTTEAHYNTLGTYSGSTRYAYCDQCGKLLDKDNSNRY